MDDIFSLFTTDDDAEAQQMAAARAAVLRRQQAAGNLGMLTGDKVLSGFGRSQVEQAGHGEGQLAQVGNARLTMALGRLKAAQAAQLEAQQAARDHALKVGDRTDERDWLEKEHAKDRVSRERAAKLSAGSKDDAKTEASVEALSKRMEAVPALSNDLATMNKYAAMDQIPGIGPYASRAPAWAPGISEDDIKSRQAQKGLLGAILKEQSGTTVSEGELNRKLEEMGMGPGATEQQVRDGLARLTTIARETVRAKEAGYKPEVVQEARRRGMSTSADLPAAPAAAEPAAGGLAPEQMSRLEELRKKRKAGLLK